MKYHEFIIRDEALTEMKSAYDWYESKRIGLGEKFISRLEDCYKRIDRHPELYPQKHKSQRQALLRGFPYVVMYKKEKDQIIIYAVFHTSQHPLKKYRS